MTYKINELIDDAKSVGIRLNFSTNKDYVILYHGTSEKCGNEIIKNGFFKDGFFFSNTSKSMYGDSVYWYAKNRAKQNNEDGHGVVLTMKVAVGSFHINSGTAEIESDGDLYLWNDGIWRNKKEELISIDFKDSLELSKDLKINNKFANLLVNTIRNWYFNLKKDRHELFDDLKELLENIKEKYNTKRKLYNFAKNYIGISGEELENNLNILANLENINVFIKPITEKFITKFSLFENKMKDLPKDGEYVILEKYNSLVLAKIITSQIDHNQLWKIKIYDYKNKYWDDFITVCKYDNNILIDYFLKEEMRIIYNFGYDEEKAKEKYEILNKANKYNI